jgi:hypothetical protein
VVDPGRPERNHRGTAQNATLLDSPQIRRKDARELGAGARVDSVEKLVRDEIQSASDEEVNVMQEQGESTRYTECE